MSVPRQYNLLNSVSPNYPQSVLGFSNPDRGPLPAGQNASHPPSPSHPPGSSAADIWEALQGVRDSPAVVPSWRPFVGVSQARSWSRWPIFVGKGRQKLINLMEIDF